MVADIFYPLFTLKITDLSCFIDTKKSGALPPPPPGHLPGPPGGLAAFPIAQMQKNNGPIFFPDYSCYYIIYLGIVDN